MGLEGPDVDPVVVHFYSGLPLFGMSGNLAKVREKAPKVREFV